MDLIRNLGNVHVGVLPEGTSTPVYVPAMDKDSEATMVGTREQFDFGDSNRVGPAQVVNGDKEILVVVPMWLDQETYSKICPTEMEESLGSDGKTKYIQRGNMGEDVSPVQLLLHPTKQGKDISKDLLFLKAFPQAEENYTFSPEGKTLINITFKIAELIDPGNPDDGIILKIGEDFGANVPANGVSIENASDTLEKGSGMTLVSRVTPTDATDKTVKWTTSDSSVISVDEDSGFIFGQKEGTAKLTVTTNDGGFTDEVDIMVVVSVTGVVIDNPIAELEPGDEDDVTCTISPGDATNKAVTWTSSDTGVATIDSDGHLIAVADGTTTIQVVTLDGGLTDSFELTVRVPVTGVSITQKPTDDEISVSEEFTLVATVAPGDATNKAVTWSSGDENIVTVNETGKITGIAEGSAIITVLTEDGGFSDQVTITVTP